MSSTIDRRFFWLLATASRKAQSFADTRLENLGITATQAGALFAFPSTGNASTGNPSTIKTHLSVNDIAATLDLAQSAASTLVQRLEKAGFVAREPDDADGRAVRLFLTARGREMRTKAADQARAMNALLIDGLTKEQQADVSSWLQTVIRKMNRAENQNGDGS